MRRNRSPLNPRKTLLLAPLMLLALTPWILSGCGGAPGGTLPGDTTPLTDGGGGQTPGGDTTTPAVNYKGVVSGSVDETRSTRESLETAEGESAQQEVPTDLDPSQATVAFEDLEGEPLVDAQGEPIPPTDVDSAGSFTAEGLPVGVDFVVAVDLDGDGTSDIEQVAQIPADETGEAGELNDVVVDPLTTLIVAQLRAMFEEQGINPDELGISLTAIVERVIDAYVHLFEESGIDQSISLADLDELTGGDITALFEALIPAGARTGMDTFQGNMALAQASEVEAAVRAAAEVFLRAGFPIADDPGGIDLSFLGDLPDVETESIDMIRPPDDTVIRAAQVEGIEIDQEQLEQLLSDGTLQDILGDGTLEGLVGEDPTTLPETVLPYLTEGQQERPIVYVSTVSEPDRNFVVNEELDPEAGRHRLPVLNERLLGRMAELHLQGRVVTLRNLYRLLTDADVGLGVRIAYNLPPPPGQMGPPAMVLETADGNGITRDIQSVVQGLFQAGLVDPGKDFDELHAQLEQIRETMRELLAGTVPPTVERLFGPILHERIASLDELLSVIRKATVHLPFNRSGPSMFFVLADGDPFRPDAGEVNPVSVDLEFGQDGRATRVWYNSDHTGMYFLGFTHETNTRNLVQVLVRETGRWMHGPNGQPIFLDMSDTTLFEAVDGVPFAEFVSDEGTFWPGVPVATTNPEYRLGEETATGATQGPTMQLFVLATAPGQDAEPVRVNYDVGTGTFTYDPNGRYYMMFLPETQEQGVFGLYDVELNFMASVQDLTAENFVHGPPQTEDSTTLPPDADVPPPDDTQPPPDDTQPPTDDTQPPAPVNEPPDGVLPAETGDVVVPPPDGTQPPTDGAVPPDGTTPPEGEFPPLEQPMPVFEPAWVTPGEVIGLSVQQEFFRNIFGTDVPNERYDANGNPYFDDVNGNGIEDEGEFTSDHRPTLFNAEDWRSTDVSRYYRRTSGGAVLIEDVDFQSADAMTFDGEALVARNYLPRLNALRFGRPNTAINLLTTFMPPEFLDGTHGITEDTPLGVFQAAATLNLIMEQVFNVEAVMDIDGDGPMEAKRLLVDGHMFVLPIGDPFVLLLDGFEALSEVPADSAQPTGPTGPVEPTQPE